MKCPTHTENEPLHSISCLIVALLDWDFSAPDTYLWLALCIVGVFAAFWLMMTAAGFFPVLLLRGADYQYVADPEPTISRAMMATGGNWLPSMGFEPEGVIRPLGIPMALFRHRDSFATMAVYFAEGNTVIEAVSMFPNGIELTTTNTIDGVCLPNSPGALVQCLPSFGLHDQWQEHLESVEVLRRQCSLAEQQSGPINEWVRESVQRQIDHLFSRPWLILTFPYRYMVTRNRYRNVPLTAQIERGWLDPRTLSDVAHGLLR